jgi:hypothetical protein
MRLWSPAVSPLQTHYGRLLRLQVPQQLALGLYFFAFPLEPELGVGESALAQPERGLVGLGRAADCHQHVDHVVEPADVRFGGINLVRDQGISQLFKCNAVFELQGLVGGQGDVLQGW